MQDKKIMTSNASFQPSPAPSPKTSGRSGFFSSAPPAMTYTQSGHHHQPPPPPPPPPPFAGASTPPPPQGLVARVSSQFGLDGNSTHRRGSVNSSTLMFFRNIMGQRNYDYRSDGPGHHHHHHHHTGSSNDYEASVQRRGMENQHYTTTNNQRQYGGNAPPPPPPATQYPQQQTHGGGGGGGGWFSSLFHGRWEPADRRRRRILELQQNRYYKGLLIFFTNILLFGGECRLLFLRKEGDIAADVLFIITMLFFLVDIIMRVDAEPNYYRFAMFGLGSATASSGVGGSNRYHDDDDDDDDDNNNNNNNNNRDEMGAGGATANNPNRSTNRAPASSLVSTNQLTCCGSPFVIGSFLFWCDVISALALITDISIFSNWRFDQEVVTITLNKNAFPTSGLDSVNTGSPISFEPYLLITIAKTARLARFIRSSTAIKISSKINWYCFLNLISPEFWYGAMRTICLLCCPCFSKKCLDHDDDDTNNNNANVPLTDLLRRTSWGGIGLGALAAARAEAKKNGLGVVPGQASFHSQSRSGSGGSGALTSIKQFASRSLSIFGVKQASAEPAEWHRELAAIRIQRAWRHVLRQRKAAEEDEFDQNREVDMDWHGRPASGMGGAVGSSSRFEKAIKQKSFLTRYNQMNSGHFNNKSTELMQSRDGVITSVGRGGQVTRSKLSSHPVSAAVVAAAAEKRRSESQVGSAMRELTGQRVAIGIIVTLILTVVFTYSENDASLSSTMIVLHTQTAHPNFADKSLTAARSSSIPDLFEYRLANGEKRCFYDPYPGDLDKIGSNGSSLVHDFMSCDEMNTEKNPRNHLRDREVLRVEIRSQSDGSVTVGYFDHEEVRRQEAWVALLSTVFILCVWFFGVTAFAGPVMILVVIPIERMVRLLGMLTLDPLGYQSTARYSRFVAEEDEFTKNTNWTKEVLKGMETSFLMSTILRIGSLMRVGFGSAGVEIIRNNLEKGQNSNTFMLSSQGSTVSCIFLFCDIRQFTDATESLQEEVFVFTNRIAAVVHSICHSYGGSANKNVGDAFLLSWRLDDASYSSSSAPPVADSSFVGISRPSAAAGDDAFQARSNQADKALLSVVKICMALHFDDFYLEALSEVARTALLKKLARRAGPVVQMGFGLHAGKAVQGAIGSERKIDATYVSEAVERAEFLESSTKKYGVPMLMSDNFHRLLHASNRRRCRKLDQILIRNDDDENDEDDDLNGDIMELWTFDMDIDNLWGRSQKVKAAPTATASTRSDSGRDHNDASETGSDRGSRREAARRGQRRLSLRMGPVIREQGSDEMLSEVLTAPGSTAGGTGNGPVGSGASTGGGENGQGGDGTGGAHVNKKPELILPTGPAMYNANVWVSSDLKKIRHAYIDGLFFQNFSAGLQSFYSKDWEHAKQCFGSILNKFEDGPSRYYYTQIEKNNGKPPRGFVGYGIA